MIFVLPTAIEPPDYAAQEPRRPAPAAFLVAGVIAALFLLDRLVVAGVTHHWRFIPEAVALAAAQLTASCALYTEPAQFAPWQLWTYALLQDGWWELIVSVVVLLSIGRSIEQAIGSLRLLAASLAITAIAATVHALSAPPGGVAVGAHGLIGGLIGLAWALFRHQQVRCALGYWLIVVVGVVRFHIDIRSLALLYVAQDLLRLYCANELAWSDIAIAGAAAGWLMGFLARRSLR